MGKARKPKARDQELDGSLIGKQKEGPQINNKDGKLLAFPLYLQRQKSAFIPANRAPCLWRGPTSSATWIRCVYPKVSVSLSLFKLNNSKLEKTFQSFLIPGPLLCKGSFCVYPLPILLHDSVCSVQDFLLLPVALENFLDFLIL